MKIIALYFLAKIFGKPTSTLSDAVFAGVYEQPEKPRRCARSCFRPGIIAPLCGSDGVTYSNRCQFNKARCKARPSKILKITKKGPCEQSKDQNVPVFGWMVLDTAADLSDLSSRKMDELECPTFCIGMIYKPVCASNNRTFLNECALKRYIC